MVKKFTYSLRFSPYVNIVRAKNRKHAWEIICWRWSEYDCDKVAYLH